MISPNKRPASPPTPGPSNPNFNLGPKRKRGRPRRLSGSEAVPLASGLVDNTNNDELHVQTEDMSSKVKEEKGMRDGSGDVSPKDAKATDLMSEADSNDGLASVCGSNIRQVPKKRLFMDRNNSTCSDRSEHNGSPGSSGSSLQLPNSTTDCEQPENLSMKRHLPEENQIQRIEKDEPIFNKPAIDMKKFWEERLANGLYGQNGLPDPHSSSSTQALLTAAAAVASAEDPAYLASFQLQPDHALFGSPTKSPIRP